MSAHDQESSFIVDEKDSLTKVVLALAFPAMLEGMSRVAAHYVDTAMVGSLGGEATAAVGINASTVYLLWSLLQSLAIAFSVLVATSIGSKDNKRVQKVIRHGMIASGIVGAVVSIVMATFGSLSPIWLGAAEEVIPAACSYIQVVGAAAFFQSVSMMASGLLRGAGNTKIPFIVNLLANLINIVGNIILIPQPSTVVLAGLSLSLPGFGMGVMGAAIATAVSICFSAIVMCWYLLSTMVDASIDARGFEKSLIDDALRIGNPIAFERMVLAGGQIILTMMVANLGTVAMASHYIVNSVATLAFEASTGFSVAATTLVAQCQGAGKKVLAYKYANTSLKLGVLVTIVFSIVVFAAAQFVAGIFTSDINVVPMTVFLVRMDAIYEPLLAVSTVLYGVFRGYEDTRFPFFVSVMGFLVTRLSSGYVLAYIFGLGLLGIWIGIALDVIVRAVMCIWHRRKYRFEDVAG